MGEIIEPSDASVERTELLTGEGLRLQLQCPKCNTVGWVEWRQLPHLLRCQGCRNSFWIDRSGHIQSEHEVGSVRVKCPRCQTTREWPKGVVVKQLNCLACGFDFSLGLDAAPQAPPPPKKKSRKSKPLPRAAVAAIIAGTLLLFGLAVLAVVRWTQPDAALLEAVQAFNAAVLAGESQKARQCVCVGQEQAFDAWTLINGANRPLGQPGPVKVEVVQYSSDAALVQVSYYRTIQDMHTQRQSWRRDPGGGWQFDPSATLQQGE